VENDLAFMPKHDRSALLFRQEPRLPKDAYGNAFEVTFVKKPNLSR
jgi:hypothetical protein